MENHKKHMRFLPSQPDWTWLNWFDHGPAMSNVSGWNISVQLRFINGSTTNLTSWKNKPWIRGLSGSIFGFGCIVILVLVCIAIAILWRITPCSFPPLENCLSHQLFLLHTRWELRNLFAYVLRDHVSLSKCQNNWCTYFIVITCHVSCLRIQSYWKRGLEDNTWMVLVTVASEFDLRF